MIIMGSRVGIIGIMRMILGIYVIRWRFMRVFWFVRRVMRWFLGVYGWV